MRLSFTIPGPPVPKARARVFFRKGQTKPSAATPARSAKYEKHVRAVAAAHAAAQRWRYEPEARLRILAVFYCADNITRDLDNLLKGVQDGINGAGIWRDDSQLDEICARRRPADRANPRVYVEIERLEQ